MEYPEKQVDFFRYCHVCKHWHKREDESPCNECIAHPVNEYSRRPIKFEAKSDDHIFHHPIRKLKEKFRRKPPRPDHYPFKRD